MTRMRYGANFFAVWASRAKPKSTGVMAPTVGETWVFTDLPKKERKDGSLSHMPTPKVGETWIFTDSEEHKEKESMKVAEELPVKVMGVLTTYGVIMAAAYKVGFKDAGERIAQKLSLVNSEKEKTRKKIYSTSSTAKEILVKVSNIEQLLLDQEGKKKKEGVVTGAGAGGRKKEKDSDGESHSDDGDDGQNGSSNNRGGSGGANGGNDAIMLVKPKLAMTVEMGTATE